MLSQAPQFCQSVGIGLIYYNNQLTQMGVTSTEKIEKEVLAFWSFNFDKYNIKCQINIKTTSLWCNMQHIKRENSKFKPGNDTVRDGM